MLTDESLMPYGPYQNWKLANVPGPYLLMIYEEGCSEEVREYIDENMDAIILEKERPEGL